MSHHKAILEAHKFLAAEFGWLSIHFVLKKHVIIINNVLKAIILELQSISTIPMSTKWTHQ